MDKGGLDIRATLTLPQTLNVYKHQVFILTTLLGPALPVPRSSPLNLLFATFALLTEPWLAPDAAQYSKAQPRPVTHFSQHHGSVSWLSIQNT